MRRHKASQINQQSQVESVANIRVQPTVDLLNKLSTDDVKLTIDEIRSLAEYILQINNYQPAHQFAVRD